MKICDKTALKSVERTHAKKFESIRDGLIEKKKNTNRVVCRIIIKPC